MISFEESLAMVDQVLAGRRVETELLPVQAAHGRVLAETVVSRLNQPPFDKSAMDGYAIPAGEQGETYVVVEHVPAGKAPSRALQPGEAMRVMTGAPVPEGTARVVMWEKTDNGMEQVRIHDHGGKTNICRKGEDLARGAPLFENGTRLGAVETANLIGCGVRQVQVYCPVRIAILATGDELRTSPDGLDDGCILDTNSPLLAGLAREHGLEVTAHAIVADNLEAHKAAIGKAAAGAHILVLTGGVSEGDFDFVAAALRATGYTIHYDKVSVQPGKPLTFATGQDGTIVFGLPGNPVSVLNSFYLCVLRGVAHLTGRSPAGRAFPMPLAEAIRRPRAKRTAFVPCVVKGDGTIERIQYHGSGHLLALSRADGMIEIPLGVHELEAGTKVLFYPRFQD